MFSAVGQGPYQIVIDVAGGQPTANVTVALSIPGSLKALAPAGSALRVFYKLFSVTEDESEEAVQMLPEYFPADASTATVSAPPEAFAGEETKLTSYRAVLFVGFGPAPPAVAIQKAAASAKPTTSQSAECKGPLIQFPVDPGTPVGRSFGQMISPINQKLTMHAGVDLSVGAGTPVLAAAPGTVIESRFQMNVKSGFGYGNTIVIRHDDGGTSRYGHLKDGTLLPVDKTKRILAGQQIALSDSTGGVEGAHPHLEYAPKGMPVVDPEPCLYKVTFTNSVCTKLPSIPSTNIPPGPPEPLYRIDNSGNVSVPVGVQFTGWSDPSNGSGNPTRTSCAGWDLISSVFGTTCVRSQSGPAVTSWTSSNLLEGGAPRSGLGQVTTPPDRPPFNSFTLGPALVCN